MNPAVLITLCLLLAGCDKGYRIRFANYYHEKMDTVSIGDQIHYTGVEINSVTDYTNISRGAYDIRCVASDRKVFSTSVWIPGHGTGDKTVQVDAVSQVSVIDK